MRVLVIRLEPAKLIKALPKQGDPSIACCCWHLLGHDWTFGKWWNSIACHIGTRLHTGFRDVEVWWGFLTHLTEMHFILSFTYFFLLADFKILPIQSHCHIKSISWVCLFSSNLQLTLNIYCLSLLCLISHPSAPLHACPRPHLSLWLPPCGSSGQDVQPDHRPVPLQGRCHRHHL